MKLQINNQKIFHDYQGDLTSIKEGLILLENSENDEVNKRVITLLIEKCNKISNEVSILKKNLESRQK